MRTVTTIEVEGQLGVTPDNETLVIRSEGHEGQTRMPLT